MNIQNKLLYVLVIVIILGIGVYAATHISKKQPVQKEVQPQQQVQNTNNAPVQPTATPTQSEANNPVEDPEDIVAGLYKNPIQNPSTQEGFAISDSLVENNVDSTGKATDDHLELTLKNIADKDLSDFEVYYLITDTVTGQKEGYYKKLTDFVLQSGKSQAVHFDNGTGPGHFNANKNSLYYKSPNKLLFDVTVNTAGYKIQTVQISKDAGGAEQND